MHDFLGLEWFLIPRLFNSHLNFVKLSHNPSASHAWVKARIERRPGAHLDINSQPFRPSTRQVQSERKHMQPICYRTCPPPVEHSQTFKADWHIQLRITLPVLMTLRFWLTDLNRCS